MQGPCKTVKCTWKAWTDWSATCGLAQRTRSIQSTQITVQQPDCSGLLQKCTQLPQKETKKTMCTCQTVKCTWNQWSDWSATCGKASRTRTIKWVYYHSHQYLIIIPRARMGCESIVHEVEGQMGYWLRGHEGERNHCFSKIQLVGKKYQDKLLLL